jgi:hypothetical protein
MEFLPPLPGLGFATWLRWLTPPANFRRSLPLQETSASIRIISGIRDFYDRES